MSGGPWLRAVSEPSTERPPHHSIPLHQTNDERLTTRLLFNYNSPTPSSRNRRYFCAFRKSRPLKVLRHIIISIIDFVHRPFSRWIDKQTFRYLACGGGNMVLNALIFNLCFEVLLPRQDWHLLGFLITPESQAFAIATVISTPIGFLLSRYVVFTESNIRGRVQAFRYGLLVLTCIFLNYAFLKVFVNWFGIYPTVAYPLTIAIVAVFSYVSQRHFTFKTKEAVIK